MDQHFSGNGSQVTKKFKPIDCKIVEEVLGFFSDVVEQEYTEDYIEKYGYNNVRGGKYVNSKTLIVDKTLNKNKKITCLQCGGEGQYTSSCYAKKHIRGYYLK